MNKSDVLVLSVTVFIACSLIVSLFKSIVRGMYVESEPSPEECDGYPHEHRTCTTCDLCVCVIDERNEPVARCLFRNRSFNLEKHPHTGCKHSCPVWKPVRYTRKESFNELA